MPAESFDRRSEILSALRTHGRLSTRTLSGQFGVSEVTIRSDLAQLEGNGWVRRVHGGAEIVGPLQGEESFFERRTRHEHEKQRVAKAAAALLTSGETLLIDNSTSAWYLAHEIGHLSLRVVTNSFPVAALLAPLREIEVMMLGGHLRRETLSVVGPFLPTMLADLHADWLFVGASGLSARRGLTDADSREVEAKQAMLAHAGHVVALVDASKFEREAFRSVAPLHALHTLVTDGPPPAELATALRDANIEVIVA